VEEYSLLNMGKAKKQNYGVLTFQELKIKDINIRQIELYLKKKLI
jgi:hypothetical protein